MDDFLAKLELARDLRRSAGVSVAGARSRNPERSEGSRVWLGTRCDSPTIKGKTASVTPTCGPVIRSKTASCPP